MNRRVLISACAAALLTAVAAQQQQQPWQPTGGQQRTQPALPLAGAAEQKQDRTPSDQTAVASQITLVGCVQRESDYRQGIESAVGTSGTAASGSNQFVLINASLDAPVTAEPSGRAIGTSGITSAQAMAYGLGGTRTADLARHVGKRVEVKGAIAATDPRRSNTGVSPTRPILQTVTVSSIREVAGSCRM